MDSITKEERSKIMMAIKGKNTKPELLVRKYLFSLGYGYKLHYNKLPGRPDIALPKYKVAIFVNGCFWHRHHNCKLAKVPQTSTNYWIHKFKTNKERDLRNYASINKLGWKVVVIWECELVNKEKAKERLKELIVEI